MRDQETLRKKNQATVEVVLGTVEVMKTMEAMVTVETVAKTMSVILGEFFGIRYAAQ